MSIKMIDDIFRTLNVVERLLEQKDSKGLAWDLRINVIWSIFRAFDAGRFQLRPVNIERVLNDLRDLTAYIEECPLTFPAEKKIAVKITQKIFAPKRDRDMQILYGLAWAQLSPEEYRDAADLLARRLLNSNQNISFFKGAKCLDLATGIGRWALAMVQLGARQVVATDFSETCLEEAHRRLDGLVESKRIRLIHGNLYKLPSTMNSAFDFVCANGVIHHLPDPAGGIERVYRCTKKGGRAFIFVFTKNDAPWWPAVEIMRRLAATVPLHYAHKILKFYAIPGSKIFNVLDYSYTPIQHKFDRSWV
ncbi:MAG: class I SAM-dependent methyltransferase, partial [Elusimicrobiota bacterium]